MEELTKEKSWEKVAEVLKNLGYDEDPRRMHAVLQKEHTTGTTALTDQATTDWFGHSGSHGGDLGNCAGVAARSLTLSWVDASSATRAIWPSPARPHWHGKARAYC